MNKIYLLALLGLLIHNASFSQTESKFVPSGKPEVLIFSNFSSTFADSKNLNKFELTRGYFGYLYNFSPLLSARATLDVADPGVGNLQMTAHLKFAWLKYQKDRFTAYFGMIATTQYGIQEKKWGYRYIYKSFMDAYSFGPSADIGANLAYNLSKKISADLIVVNGEGNKKLEADSTLKVGLGITVLPTKEITLRGYVDKMKKFGNSQNTYALFSGFENEKFNLNAEFNYQTNQGYKSSHDFWGYSFYGTLNLNRKVKILSRFDLLKSQTPSAGAQPWNSANDGRYYFLGLEFSPVSGVKISPNFQGKEPAPTGKSFVSKFSLNLELRI